jgi:hypothetical protein
MTAALAARLIVSAIAAGQGVAPLFIDLNRTHATNPFWPDHARFHVVWQVFTGLPLAAATVALLWWPGPSLRHRFYFAAFLAAASLLGFFVATAFRRLYDGTLRDPNGFQPARLRVGSRDIAVDMNLALVTLASVLLLVSLLLFGFS